MKLKDKNRTGLIYNPRMRSELASLVYAARATIPVIETLRAAGADIETVCDHIYLITLSEIMPAHIVAVHINKNPGLALRMNYEPKWPDEHKDDWRQADWLPCPVCQAPIVWYEAGYVPGYRVCTKPPHHHCLVVRDSV